MNKIKQLKIILLSVALIILGVLLVLFLKLRRGPERGIQTAPIPTDRTELIDHTESEETNPNPLLDKLPYDGQTFYIDYPEFDIYTVHIKAADTEQTKKAAYEWFINQGANLEELKIRFLTASEEDIIERIISELPIEEPNFEIWVSAKTNSFIVTILGTSFDEGKKKAVAWFADSGLEDLSKVNILWEDKTE